MIFCISFTFLYVHPKEKAEAAFQLAIPAVAVGFSGAYTLGAIAVGTLALGLGIEYGDEIKTHGYNVWDSTTETVKNAWTTSVNSALAVGSSVATLSGEVSDWFKSQSEVNAVNALSSHYAGTRTKLATPTNTIQWSDGSTSYESLSTETIYPEVLISYRKLYSGGVSHEITYNIDSNYTYMVTKGDGQYFYTNRLVMKQITDAFGNLYFRLSNVGAYTLAGASTTVQNNIFAEFPVDGTEHSNALAKFFVERFDNLMNYMLHVATGTTITVIPKANLSDISDSLPNVKEKINQQIDSFANTGVAISVPVPMSKPRVDTLVTPGTLTEAKPSEELTYNPTDNTYTLPDGSVYTGNPTWDFPIPSTFEGKLVIPGVNTGDLVDVATGDIVYSPTAPTPTAPTETDNILTGLWDWLKGILQSILDAILSLATLVGLIGLLETVVTWVQSISGSVSQILSYVNPFSDSFFLKVAFIPTAGYYQQYWNDIYKMYKDKIPIIGQLMDFFNDVKNVNYVESIPVFEVELPDDLGGHTLPIIDFGFFGDYRTLILNFIRFTAWFFFLKRLLKYLPKVVY